MIVFPSSYSVSQTNLGKSKTSSLLSSIPTALLPQSFCDFFVNKISTIRDNLNSQTHWWPPAVTQLLMVPHWPPSTLCQNRQYAKCWTRLQSKHANWTLLRCRYWLNSLMTFSRPLLQLLMTLLTGSILFVFKSAVVRLLLKKCKIKSLNTEDLKNLPFFCKITENIALL